MTLDEFRASLAQASPPAGLNLALRALWYDANGDWAQAHSTAQEDQSADGAWVHAYLHRVEGDLSNAAYWYRRAGKPVAQGELSGEWAALATALLAA